MLPQRYLAEFAQCCRGEAVKIVDIKGWEKPFSIVARRDLHLAGLAEDHVISYAMLGRKQYDVAVKGMMRMMHLARVSVDSSIIEPVCAFDRSDFTPWLHDACVLCVSASAQCLSVAVFG
jgi:hypothetical protein